MENSLNFKLPQAEAQGLYVNNFGRSQTKPGHQYGPAVRSFYLIHYILDGEGSFSAGGSTYRLEKGQGFLIEPDYMTVYTAHMQRPWTYVWVGFSGSRALELLRSVGLSQNSPVFTCQPQQSPEKYILDMLEHNHATPQDAYRREAMLLLFFSALAQAARPAMPARAENAYVEQAIRYIQNNYHDPLRVEDIARYVGVNRSYLSILFKKHTGLSPVKYLQTFRMTRAAQLLAMTQLPIAAVAFSCGYQEPEAFHKAFKQRMGLSPSQYRAQERSGTQQDRDALSKIL